MKHDQGGFTLVEIMIVVAIIATLASMAILSMMRSRMNANEVSAIASLRTISNGAQNYYAGRTPNTFPAQLTDLAKPVSDPAYIDSSLASGQKQGYTFTYVQVSADDFTCNANPVTPGRTGNRTFYLDATGRMTAAVPGPAGPGDPPVE